MKIPVQLMVAGMGVVLLGLLWFSALAQARRHEGDAHWIKPARGPITREFSYGANPFKRGQHRGIDIHARPGAQVRSACGGRVSFAGSAAGGSPTVSVDCGPWHVTYMPLRRISVRNGETVRKGRLMGELGSSKGHRGLHFGVRRRSETLGYVDPTGFLNPAEPSLPMVGPGSTVRVPRRVVPRVRPLPTPWTQAVNSDLSPVADIAPWPVWVALVLVLAGLFGVGRISYRRRRRVQGVRIGPSNPTSHAAR